MDQYNYLSLIAPSMCVNLVLNNFYFYFVQIIMRFLIFSKIYFKKNVKINK